MTQNRELELIAQVEALRSVYVEHERITAIKDDIRRLLARDNKASEGGCMLLTGPSGSGKTKLIEDFISDYPRIRHGRADADGNLADDAPVICATVPDTSLKTLTERLFHIFSGIPAKSRSRRFDLQEAIAYHAKEMNTRLLILEEAHQAIDRKRDTVAHDVAVFLKDLSNKAQFSLLIVGTGKAKRLIAANDELERRVVCVSELSPFRWDERDDRETFLGLLDVFDDWLAKPLGRNSGLCEGETALRIYVATGGLLGRLARLLENAGILAVREQAKGSKDAITLECLARAFEKTALHKTQANPFLVPDPLGLMTRPDELTVPTEESRPRKRRTRRANADDHFRP